MYLASGAHEPAPWAHPAELVPEGRAQHEQRSGLGEPLAQHFEELIEHVALVGAEHQSHDDVEGDGLQMGVESEGLSDRPGGHVPTGGVGHDLPIRRHSVAVKAPHHERSIAAMGFAVEQQQRASAQERLEHRCARGSAELLRVQREHGFDVGRVGQNDHRGVAGQPDGEDVAIPPVAPGHEGNEP